MTQNNTAFYRPRIANISFWKYATTILAAYGPPHLRFAFWSQNRFDHQPDSDKTQHTKSLQASKPQYLLYASFQHQ